MNIDSVGNYNLGIGNIDGRVRDVKALVPTFDRDSFG